MPSTVDPTKKGGHTGPPLRIFVVTVTSRNVPVTLDTCKNPKNAFLCVSTPLREKKMNR